MGKRYINTKKFSLLPFAFYLLTLIGCSQPLYKDAEFIMGTYVEVVSRDPRAKDIVFSEFKRLEGIFNLFDENSVLSRLNATGSLTASQELFEILKKSKEFYKKTNGAFDVTIAPLSLLWKKAIKNKELPKDEDIKNALSLVGYDDVYLDEKTSNVKLLKLGSKIDLGGIAKGFAIDRAVRLLRQAKITSCIVNAGGDLYCLGENYKQLWRVGIRDPRMSKQIVGKLELENMAAATSGDYEQFFIFQNKRYSHIINPKTGYPADSGIIFATVIAPDALTADALATALIVLGKDKGMLVLKPFKGVSAKFMDENGRNYDL